MTEASSSGQAQTEASAPPPARRLRRALIGTIIAALVLGAAGGAATALAITKQGASGQGASGGYGASANAAVCNAARVAHDVLPSVVTVSVRSASGASGVGSGEVIRSNGYIVTNNHVISAAVGGGSIAVTLSDGNTLDAELVGRDPRSDLAVLKVSASGSLPVIGLADSDHVVVGQPVVALGAPLGLSSTVTSGIVSALDRNVPVPSDNGETAVLAGAIQTDAAINPGNSGGALVDCQGRLIGVNTAIATVPNSAGQAGGGSVGIGFAVPSNLAAHIADQLIAGKPIAYAYLGFEAAPVTSHSGDTVGLFVQSVSSGGPAEQAGLRVGDVITHLAGHRISDLANLTVLITAKDPGDRVEVVYVRDGANHTTQLTLGSQAVQH